MPLADVDVALLVHERELDLLRTLFELPDVMQAALEERAPHKITTWVRELADRFHGFYHDCYVMGEGVTLVSSADETAKDVYRVLADSDALRPAHLPPPSHGFTTTGDAAEFTRLARRFLGPEVGADDDTVFGDAVVRSVPTPAAAGAPAAAQDVLNAVRFMNF